MIEGETDLRPRVPAEQVTIDSARPSAGWGNPKNLRLGRGMEASGSMC